MKLNKLIRKLKKQYPDQNPDIKICTSSGEFEILTEVLNRQDFHDHTSFGTPLPKKDYIILQSEKF